MYALLTIVSCGLKCGRGGRADNWWTFETYAESPGGQCSCCYKNMLETTIERGEYEIKMELAISWSGLAIRTAPCFAIDERGGCQFSINGGKKSFRNDCDACGQGVPCGLFPLSETL